MFWHLVICRDTFLFLLSCGSLLLKQSTTLTNEFSKFNLRFFMMLLVFRAFSSCVNCTNTALEQLVTEGSVVSSDEDLDDMGSWSVDASGGSVRLRLRRRSVVYFDGVVIVLVELVVCFQIIMMGLLDVNGTKNE